MSLRHKSPREKQGVDASGADALLDAAKASLLELGVRRTTLTGVASRAGVSRMTVYRRYPSTSSLVAALMTREFGEQLARAAAEASGRRTGRARLAASVTGGAAGLGDHPLLRRVLELDPELLLPYLTRRLGETQRLALLTLERLIEDGQADGSIRAGDGRLLAATLLFTLQPFVLSARIAVPGVSRKALLAELGVLVDRYLQP